MVKSDKIKKILASYRNSSLSQKDFCSENKLSTSTLYSWITKEKLKEKKLDFVSVSIAEKSFKTPDFKQESYEKLVLKINSGISLELPDSISPSWLSSLLKEML